MIVAFIANYFYKVSAIVLILLGIALGVVLTLYREKKAPKNNRNTSQANKQKGYNHVIGIHTHRLTVTERYARIIVLIHRLLISDKMNCVHSWKKI